MGDFWRIIDGRTGEFVTLAAFFSEAGALLKIEAWRERHERGERPDISKDTLDALQAVLVVWSGYGWCVVGGGGAEGHAGPARAAREALCGGGQ